MRCNDLEALSALLSFQYINRINGSFEGLIFRVFYFISYCKKSYAVLYMNAPGSNR
jgi:hypothetical protein